MTLPRRRRPLSPHQLRTDAHAVPCLRSAATQWRVAAQTLKVIRLAITAASLSCVAPTAAGAQQPPVNLAEALTHLPGPEEGAAPPPADGVHVSSLAANVIQQLAQHGAGYLMGVLPPRADSLERLLQRQVRIYFQVC